MANFEAVAEVGDVIKCYDFEPVDGREEYYVIGLVVEKGFLAEYGIKGYRVVVFEDTMFQDDDARDEIATPFQMQFMDFDNRITLVETAYV